ncbi:MAG TPA: excinuclease ABC subunit UvrB [Candidatus Paceibacterota bacterium]|nr:excinuclease ABC subunit UvrB [Candidatus Paceibacterota bacterium]
MLFKIHNEFQPAGDQPKAIEGLVSGLKKGLKHQTLLGVTGSGKTFTAANVIAQIQKPTLVLAHNKTLAAQLAQEYRDFFPENAVHYFVSYYDYYQPEAYIAASDTYIEKEAQINEEIERLRHASTQALLSRPDTIIIASVSAIYGLGSPAEYEKKHMRIDKGKKMDRSTLMRALVSVFYERTPADLKLGTFRALGNKVEIMPPSAREIFSIELSADGIEEILEIDPITRQIVASHETIFLFPAKHFITNPEQRDRAIVSIRHELEERLKELLEQGCILEADRLKRRTNYDLAMMEEIGYCNGIENYSRHMSGRSPGEPPDTLLSYFPHKPDGTPDFLTIIDESHVTVPQLRGMFAGDESRKKSLIEHGFRLPSALDNRPLRFPEFEERIGQVIFTSATPSDYEFEKSEQIVEQIIRPTGLLDPELFVRPVVSAAGYPGQVKDFIAEAVEEIKKDNRVIATTLTKKMAEDLAEYLKEQGVKSEYLHSEIKTLDRIRILTEFRKGNFDCLVGVNLLREGLDLPEVSFIGILDADKEGFLRSETSLIQTIGRAARNIAGRVVLYADTMTNSLERAISETNRRRAIQLAYNTEHGITPKTIRKNIKDITEGLQMERSEAIREVMAIEEQAFGGDLKKLLKEKERQMNDAVKELDFETAAIIRDEIRELATMMGEKPKRGRKKA